MSTTDGKNNPILIIGLDKEVESFLLGPIRSVVTRIKNNSELLVYLASSKDDQFSLIFVGEDTADIPILKLGESPKLKYPNTNHNTALRSFYLKESQPRLNPSYIYTL